MDHIILGSVKYLRWLSCSKLFLTSQKDPSYVAIHASSDGRLQTFLGYQFVANFDIDFSVQPVKDSFITQDRNEHFEGGKNEATFSRGDCGLTSCTISKK